MVKEVIRKSMLIRESGRSSDFISPSFGYGCLYNCTYCYMKRHLPTGLTVAKNIGDILTAINNHATFTEIKKPNQTDNNYITYDISCNEDFALHLKYYNWKYIFDFFKNHPKAKATFATKYVNYELLNYNPENKVRIRFSLMPEAYHSYLEPNTSNIKDRLKAINKFIEAGYDVHLNFSPVIVTKGWITHYKSLFKLVDSNINKFYKDKIKAEVIFLTHNKNKHKYNIDNKFTGEDLLWKPNIQEDKISQYGGNNIRYQSRRKTQYINEFRTVHEEMIGWNTIRYIF